MWEEQVERPPRAVRHWPRVVTPVAIAFVLGVLGRWPLAVLVLVLGAAVVTITTVSPTAARLLARAFAAISHVVGTALTFVLLGITELLVMLPAAAAQTLLPRRGPWAEGAGSWQERPAGDGLERRGFGSEPSTRSEVDGSVRRVARALVLVTGIAAVAVVLDFAAGAAIDHLRGDQDPPEATTLVPGSPAAEPALADATWAADYYDDLGRLRYDYVPFLYPRLADTATPHINSQGGVRRSYEPEAGGDLPEVWLFGGSSLWGEGQRDDHTIASALARLAEDEGLPVTTVNRGAPGFSTWQEALLFERVLTDRPAPALAVFYDGVNDTRMQAQQVTDDPTHFEYPAIHLDITGQPIGVAADAAVIDPEADAIPDDAFGPVWDRYVQASLVAKGLRQVRAVLGADGAEATPEAPAQATPDTAGGPQDAAATTVDVYRRSRALAHLLGDDAGVPTRFFWQPVEDPTPAYRRSAAAAEPATVDLSTVLVDAGDGGGGPLWIDGVHTNERGARLAAAALWRHLRPDVEAWYERRGGPP